MAHIIYIDGKHRKDDLDAATGILVGCVIGFGLWLLLAFAFGALLQIYLKAKGL